MDRFYQSVDIAKNGVGYVIHLDGRVPKTPGGAELWLPTEQSARLVAEDWSRQETKIKLASMWATQTAFSALDQVSPNKGHVIAELAAYGGSDLVCFLADHPAALVEQQKAAWTPLHDWFESTWHSKLEVTQGIVPVAQSRRTLKAIEDTICDYDVFQLAALHGLTKLAGSIIIALAVTTGRLAPDQAWSASRIDEDWQIDRWGRDAEADSLADDKKGAFLAYALFLKTVS